ncbi:MAG: hypothetical protein JWN70_1869 [Planctomycetaceae bacterium]|nr:hypothetical protein [Planctomycetaceae bacterium]
MNTQIRSKVWGLVAVTLVSLASAGSAFAGPMMPMQPRLRPIDPPIVNPGTPRLGIMGHLQYNWGMVVDSVNPGSTADRMGLERGDKIVRINDRQINSDRSYQESLWSAVRFQNGFVKVTVVDVRSGRMTDRTGHVHTGFEHSQPRFAPHFNTNFGSY